MSKELIRLRDLCMAFDDEPVLDHINLHINDKEFLTLLGPSGCGKATTLRIIGGFATPTSGDVLFDGVRINDVPPYQRQINTVFQKYALFPHMSIAENIAFGLKIKKKPKSYIDDKIRYALKLVNLDGFENRSVDSLSGGQQQRIAIARALCKNPDLLLCDEPTGALDSKTGVQVLRLIHSFCRKYGKPVVLITHNANIAKIADRIFYFKDGMLERIEKNETPLSPDAVDW